MLEHDLDIDLTVKDRGSVFLAHSTANKRSARRLAEELRFFGIRVWLDEGEIRVGDSLIAKLQQAIDETDLLVALLTPQAVRSPWVQKELEPAMLDEIEHGRVRVLPVLRQKCDLPAFLRGKLYADLSTPARYRKNLVRLAASILCHASGRHLPAFESVKDQEANLAVAESYVSRFIPKDMSDDLALIGGRVHAYVLARIAEREVPLTHTRWQDATKMDIDCQVSGNVVGFQDLEYAGIDVNDSTALHLFAATQDGYLALSPTGREVLRLLRERIPKSKWE